MATVAVGNGSAPPSAANPIPAAAVTAGVFAGSGATTFPGAVVCTGVFPVAQGALATASGFYSGVGAPTFAALDGAMYLESNGGIGARWWANTSGSGTTGTTWTAQAAP